MKKATMATVKSFIRKNEGRIYIDVKSSFDGMSDCVEQHKDRGFFLAHKADSNHGHNFGIQGAWFVGSSRDSITRIEKDIDADLAEGFHIYNCCGSFDIVAKVLDADGNTVKFIISSAAA